MVRLYPDKTIKTGTAKYPNERIILIGFKYIGNIFSFVPGKNLMPGKKLGVIKCNQHC